MSDLKTIFIVEDGLHMQRLLEFNLSHLPVKISMISSGEEAINLMVQGFIPDLILLDYMLDGINGIELIQKMKQQEEFKNIPIILMTAKGQQDIQQQAKKLGVNDFFYKPFSPTELNLRCKQLLNL
jgi:two-component system phosphate regulon response regulator PhoB